MCAGTVTALGSASMLLQTASLRGQRSGISMCVAVFVRSLRVRNASRTTLREVRYAYY